MAKNKKGDSNSNHKSKKKFPSKNVKHDPQAESARAIFGLRSEAETAHERDLRP